MTKESLKSAFEAYRTHFDMNYPKIGPARLIGIQSRLAVSSLSRDDKISFYKFTCDEGQSFINQDMAEKATGWVFCCEGALWMDGEVILDGLLCDC